MIQRLLATTLLWAALVTTTACAAGAGPQPVTDRKLSTGEETARQAGEAVEADNDRSPIYGTSKGEFTGSDEGEEQAPADRPADQDDEDLQDEQDVTDDEKPVDGQPHQDDQDDQDDGGDEEPADSDGADNDDGDDAPSGDSGDDGDDTRDQRRD